MPITCGPDHEVPLFVLLQKSQVAPVAKFTGSPRSGTVPLLVRFTDQSTGTPTSWAWDFNNDGVIDKTTRSPGYTYKVPGNYSVRLVVANAGGSSSRLKSRFISVAAPAPA